MSTNGLSLISWGSKLIFVTRQIFAANERLGLIVTNCRAAVSNQDRQFGLGALG
jgi:hypothetical protein